MNLLGLAVEAGPTVALPTDPATILAWFLGLVVTGWPMWKMWESVKAKIEAKKERELKLLADITTLLQNDVETSTRLDGHSDVHKDIQATSAQTFAMVSGIKQSVALIAADVHNTKEQLEKLERVGDARADKVNDLMSLFAGAEAKVQALSNRVEAIARPVQ